jgi:ubiquinone/menaquinone biosynthesis C-methylase UbiE
MSPPSPDSYDPAYIARFFDEYGEKEWERLTRTPVDEVSLHIHTQLLHAHIPRGARVLEIGAGAGRFTQVLAQLDCRVTVADLSPGQLALNRAKAAEHGFAGAIASWLVADICDLRRFPDGEFDAVVAYGGPISYVFDRADDAVRECRRVLAVDGVLLASVMSLWGTSHLYLNDILAIPPDRNRPIIATGDLSPHTLPENKHYCRMYRAARFRSLLERHGLEILALSASNFLSLRWETELGAIRQDESAWNELLRLETEACAEPGCQDGGTHLIAASRKRDTTAR